MKKTLAGSIILTCVCMSSLAQTSEQLAAYKATIQSQENFNRVQREAGMPEMAVPTFKEWLKAEEEKASAPAPTVSTAKKEDPKIKWVEKLEKIRPYVREVVPVGETQPNDHRSIIARKEQEQLREFADQAWAKRNIVNRNLNAIAQKHGVKRRWVRNDGRIEVLAGEADEYPIWVTSHNQIAAAGISADELWPTNSAPWPSSTTGRDLTGTNVVLGMWESGGAVNTNHLEFGGRILQLDDTTPSVDHASGVAGTMAAFGNSVSLPSIPDGAVARGVAFEAFVDARDINDFGSELADASVSSTNYPGLRLSNHSWGISPAWDGDYIDTFWYQGVEYDYTNSWYVWTQDPTLHEDPFCGSYLFDVDDGYGCAQLDGFLSTNAPRHLLIYSAGNDRFFGPAQPVYYFYKNNGLWYLVNSPPANDKDWALGDGDTYGFDSVKPPGTTKNVLTVGSVLDVYHDDNGVSQWGYASNSTITLSSFSGCGPTDDGRIKPDVVAVGEADPSVRSYGIVTPIAGTNNSYTNSYSGTSFSAPSVTGGLGLCLQRRNQLFPSLNPETSDLRNSSLKGLAIHTADDIFNPGPDYQSGWGLFNAVSAVEQVELDAQHGRGTHIKELELSVAETNSWLVSLDGSPFKVSALWSDLPGTPPGYVEDPQTPMLVNNIDLWVESENGTQTFLPWVLNPDLQNESESVRNASAITGTDNINNVEQVVINNPTPGRYRIFIAHSGGTAGGQSPTNQWVSILSSGDAPLRPVISKFEKTPAAGQFLLTLDCDPGAYLILESSSDLVSGNWETDGFLTTEAEANMVFSSSSNEVRFWRIRRETGIDQ